MTQGQKRAESVVAGCCIAMLCALLVVGAVSHGVIRHVIQTLPLWLAIVLGIRHSELTKWVALPSFAVWLGIMAAIWLSLIGWVRILTGTFSMVEVVMTIVVGASAACGLATAVRVQTRTGRGLAVALLLGTSLLDLIAIRLSLLPGIANR